MDISKLIRIEDSDGIIIPFVIEPSLASCCIKLVIDNPTVCIITKVIRLDTGENFLESTFIKDILTRFTFSISLKTINEIEENLQRIELNLKLGEQNGRFLVTDGSSQVSWVDSLVNSVQFVTGSITNNSGKIKINSIASKEPSKLGTICIDSVDSNLMAVLTDKGWIRIGSYDDSEEDSYYSDPLANIRKRVMEFQLV